ncbi:hypothetical protein EUGRSUZ_D01679 [Eucalyptus grandis]|uniref:Uncharacterized protein n=2 Tax=Eucalyptus grandis TaxID=71139 RepID=A0ACC3L5H5_EUCGR|nr:hypothetical protein EUGRSUZ_D01679 [Eucalyptus grandis]
MTACKLSIVLCKNIMVPDLVFDGRYLAKSALEKLGLHTSRIFCRGKSGRNIIIQQRREKMPSAYGSCIGEATQLCLRTKMGSFRVSQESVTMPLKHIRDAEPT